eukprot:gnl/MRDRNA2_/MRDRNA2_86662_c0_seq1.p1 gnl/MRDRNA2_/MRDRNA2_86662_c0~~gnl/MRDRNA2_/MRDRNA2_86662_c0_seq1.p1  ORF type:complete len:688 (+),score=-5.63 gnl/MRDRNA2_/MRDRNA2_86662_c0_seq1:182-2245(+)
MLEREGEGPIYDNLIINPHGGVLADDQGLGKTMTTISLLMSGRSQERSALMTSSPRLSDQNEHFYAFEALRNFRKFEKMHDREQLRVSNQFLTGETLIICPTSVVSQWLRELQANICPRERLHIHVYHGANRNQDALFLCKHDVVITTYQILALETPKFSSDDLKCLKSYLPIYQSKSPLFNINWKRLVVDEAQTIKNSRTLIHLALKSLRGKSRWCLTGTPIQNSIKDLFSYFQFLKFEPYWNQSFFRILIEIPIFQHPGRGFNRLRTILKGVLLRRTKTTRLNGTTILDLPNRILVLVRLKFNSAEFHHYKILLRTIKDFFGQLSNHRITKQNIVSFNNLFDNMLENLLKIRQFCNHYLLPRTNWNNFMIMLNNDAKLKCNARVCSLCSAINDKLVIVKCGHLFCRDCVGRQKLRLMSDSWLRTSYSKSYIGNGTRFECPNCRIFSLWGVELNKKNILETLCIKKQVCLASSSKITYIMNLMIRLKNRIDPTTSQIWNCNHTPSMSIPTPNPPFISAHHDLFLPNKVIVFSQWTSMLNLVENVFSSMGIKFARLDGSLDLSRRDDVIQNFNDADHFIVLILSLKAAAIGLNLVAANHVILLDLWWNPCLEEQAIDRTHRIGQRRDVFVHRLTIESSFENKLLQLQEQKSKFVNMLLETGHDINGAQSSTLDGEGRKNLNMIKKKK